LSSVVLYKKVVLLKFEFAECRWELFVVGCVWVSHLSRFGEVFYNTGIAIQVKLPSYGPFLLRFVCRCQNYVFKLVCIKLGREVSQRPTSPFSHSKVTHVCIHERLGSVGHAYALLDARDI
jgi:hypothetical protein